MERAVDDIMVYQRGLTQRAVRFAQDTHIALAPLHDDGTEYDCLLRVTELVERDSPPTATYPLSSHYALVDE
jgi:hypothetical protein